MLKSAVKFVLPALVAMITSGAYAQTIKEADVPHVVATLLNASQAGRTIHVAGDFGAKRANGSFTGVELQEVREIPIMLRDGVWSLEIASFVQTTDINDLKIDGIKLKDVLQAKTVAISESQLDLIRGAQELIVASTQGKKISVRGELGAKLANGSYSGIDVTDFTDTTIASNNGKYSFELPTFVHQEDFKNVAIDGVDFAKRREMIRGTAPSIKEADVARVVATILNASNAGSMVHIDGNFGAKRRDGTFTGVDRFHIPSIKIHREGGKWFIEVESYLPTPMINGGLETIKIDGVKLTDVLKAKTVKVADSQLELIRGAQAVILASEQGRTVTVRGQFGARLENGQYSGVNMTGVSATTISIYGGVTSFELPRSVQQKDLSNIEIDGVGLAKRRALIRTCEGLFLPN